ncbi:unnamed protein product [Prorocentrum cordatum]|uniref:Ion transport domain-containing protein n=1 Tax=Prorocentrum cordatum TaxID=2364126 RepID=A0ABN9XIT5_9DINO|nr:unnamed protein product [Polarella glacialis]
MAAQGGRARQLAEILAGLEQQLLPLLSPDGADAGAARGSRGICESGSVSGSAPALFDEVSQTRFLSDDVSDASYAEGEEGDLHLVKDAPGEDGRAALSPAPRQPRPLTSDVLNCTSADGGRLSQGSRLTGSFPSQEEALVPDTPSPPRSQHPEPILRGEPSQEDSALIRTSSKRSAGTKWTASIESRMSRNERLELLELWQDSDENDALIALALQATRSEMSLDWSMNITPKLSKTLSKSMKTLMVSRSSSRGFDKFFHKFTTSPVSSRRIMWECLGMLFVMYDVLFTPFEQAFFDNSASYAVLVLEGATLAYWCADLPSNFVVGYYDVRGSSRSKVPILQTSMRSIAMHYVQGWFIPDIFLLVISAISFLHAAQARCPGQLSMKFSYIAWAQSGRAIRVLKFFKLLRALKAHSVIARMREKVVSFATKTYLKVLMHLLWIVTANHYLACWWYQIGCSPDDSVVGVPSWVEANFQAADSISYRYPASIGASHNSLLHLWRWCQRMPPSGATPARLFWPP